eukprot:1157540-Pelagomonas_calceolata.AAC.7
MPLISKLARVTTNPLRTRAMMALPSIDSETASQNQPLESISGTSEGASMSLSSRPRGMTCAAMERQIHNYNSNISAQDFQHKQMRHCGERRLCEIKQHCKEDERLVTVSCIVPDWLVVQNGVLFQRLSSSFDEPGLVTQLRPKCVEAAEGVSKQQSISPSGQVAPGSSSRGGVVGPHASIR